MREPPGAPAAMNSLPSRRTMVGVMDESGRLPGAMAFASPCTRPNMFALAGLGGEVVHLVVQQESETRDRDAVAVAAVQRVGHGHGVALASTT